jgi:hypothetical protein
VIQTIVVAWLLLFVGDFLSTFCYHIPEHVFGKLHLQIHHSPKKNFRHYAVLSAKPLVLLDGLLGALPYILLAVALWPVDRAGVLIGIAFGQFHVWWRHTTALHWRTPKPVVLLCNVLFVTTPEKHWQHHTNTSKAFGDIFTLFDRPGRAWLVLLRRVRQLQRKALAAA